MKKINVLFSTTLRKAGILSLIAFLLLAGCSSGSALSSASSAGPKASKSTDKVFFNIGISQIIQHKALDDAREGFKSKIKDLGIEAQFSEQNAQGDPSNAQLIAEKFVSDKVDLILAIATPIAQASQNSTKGSDIPVVFTAVTDPVDAGLVLDPQKPKGNITGVTDNVSDENLGKLLDMVKTVRPDGKSVGVIFNTGESNSLVQVKQLEKVAGEKDLTVHQVGIAAITEVDQAMDVISSKTDTLILLTDNMLANAMEMIASKALEKKMITASPDSSHIPAGVLMSMGLSYRLLGEQAAELAKKILVDQTPVSQLPIETSKVLEKMVNEKTAKELGIALDSPAFKDAVVVK